MRLTYIAIILLAAIVVACAKQEAQLANPASVYCKEQGGTLEIVETDAGQQGICVKGEMRCDEWAYYRGECGNATAPCSPCPQLMPPAPGWCENGTIINPTPDACGCYGPPRCE